MSKVAYIWESFYETLKKLPPKDQAKLALAMLEYSFTGEIREKLNYIQELAITPMKPSLFARNVGGCPKGKVNNSAGLNGRTGDKGYLNPYPNQPDKCSDNHLDNPSDNGHDNTVNTIQYKTIQDKTVYQEIKNFFQNSLVAKLNRQFQTNGWTDEIRKLCELDKVSPERVMAVLSWHFANYDREYRQEIQSAKALREKFGRIEVQMNRAKSEEEKPFVL